MHTGFRKADLSHPGTNGTAQQTDQNLIDHQWAEKFSVPGLCHRFDQPYRGLDDAQVDLTDVHGAALGNPRQTMRIHLQDQLGDLVWVEIQPESEERLGEACSRDLGRHRQINGESDHTRLIVLIDLRPQHHALCPLRDDTQDWLPHGMNQFPVRL